MEGLLSKGPTPSSFLGGTVIELVGEGSVIKRAYPVYFYQLLPQVSLK